MLVAAGVGLVLRVAWWAYARPDPVSDFEWLRRLAEGMLDHQQYGYPRLEGGKVPLYPIVLAGLMLINRSIAWLSLVTVLISAALVPLVGVLAHRLGLGQRTAVGASLICAANPTFVLLAPVLATEHLFAALLVAALVVLVGPGQDSPQRPMTGRVVAAGAVLGLTVLTRVDALFYVPVFAGLVWVRFPRRRLIGLTVMLVTAGVLLMPWYLRNRAVIGPGSGLSTAGGATFYHGHHDGPYGWRPLTGTPLEGLHQLELHQRGYELGFEYLRRIGPLGIARDIAIATGQQFSPLSSPYALRWSTSQAGPTPDEFTQKAVRGERLLGYVNAIYYALLLGAAMLSPLFIMRVPATAAFVLYGIVGLNWLGHCVVFLGGPRYRYMAEVVFCALAAVAMAAVTGRRTVDPAASTSAVPV